MTRGSSERDRVELEEGAAEREKAEALRGDGGGSRRGHFARRRESGAARARI
jgi:hypothetical protein